jgi:hypothetical protein
MRMIRLRREALVMWQRELGAGSYSRATVRAEIRLLRLELGPLERTVLGTDIHSTAEEETRSEA